jgi:hypothetical protein
MDSGTGRESTGVAGTVATPPMTPEAAAERAAIDDYDDYDDDGECWNCGGEGVVYNCFTEYACVFPEDGCDECMRRCDVCQPSKPNPALQQVLADAIECGDHHSTASNMVGEHKERGDGE